MKCTECGADLAEGANFCPSCGHKVSNHQPSEGSMPPPLKPEADASCPSSRNKAASAQQPSKSNQQPGKSNKLLINIIAVIALLAIIGVMVYLFVLRDKEDEDSDEDIELTETESKEAVAETALPEEVPIEAPEVLAPIDYSYVCTQWLYDSDLEDMTSEELRRMRNTVYARHGRRFQSADLREYFNNFAWYEPRYDDISINELSDTERHNITLIQSHE